jgi:hypothetical protein
MRGEGEWLSWSIDGRAGAKLRLGPVFLGEISYPHDLGLGVRWKAWLNHEHLGYFRDEQEARQYIEAEILKRLHLMQPALARFQASTQPPAAALHIASLPVAMTRPLPARQQSAGPVMADSARSKGRAA